eukprot:760848-Hanusia_phi.AAC.6
MPSSVLAKLTTEMAQAAQTFQVCTKAAKHGLSFPVPSLVVTHALVMLSPADHVSAAWTWNRCREQLAQLQNLHLLSRQRLPAHWMHANAASQHHTIHVLVLGLAVSVQVEPLELFLPHRRPRRCIYTHPASQQHVALSILLSLLPH